MVKKRVTKKPSPYEVKPRIAEIGSELAKKMFPLQFNKPSINDVVERLILLEGYKHEVLTEEESAAVKVYYGMPVEKKTVVVPDNALSTIYPESKEMRPATPLEAALGAFDNN